MSHAIEVKNLVFSYDHEKNTLNGLSFNIEKGEHVALIGHNGSGKSTLTKVLVGLHSKFTGDVKVFDMPVNKDNINEIHKKVGIVFQNPDNQFVASTVAEDIAFGLENRCVKKEEMDQIIDQVLKEVGMEKFKDSAPENLSGGMKQRVAIAGVLALKPDLLILDEATSMLDPKGKREILSLIDSMKKNNPDLTILSVTHDVEEAASADKVMVLNKGEIVSVGIPDEVFGQKEALKEIRLGVPFFIQLKDALENKGVNIPDSIENMEQLEDYLCR